MITYKDRELILSLCVHAMFHISDIGALLEATGDSRPAGSHRAGGAATPHTRQGSWPLPSRPLLLLLLLLLLVLALLVLGSLRLLPAAAAAAAAGWCWCPWVHLHAPSVGCLRNFPAASSSSAASFLGLGD